MHKSAKILAACVALAGAFAAGARFGPRPPAGGPLAPGAEIAVERPTGEVVAGVGGGHPQPRTELTRLRVVKARGEPAGVRTDLPQWRVTVGGTTVVAVAD